MSEVSTDGSQIKALRYRVLDPRTPAFSNLAETDKVLNEETEVIAAL